MSDISNDDGPDVRFSFDHDPSASLEARRAVMRMFPDDGPIADDVTLAASELVTNVVIHTNDGGRLEAWARNPVRLEVSDYSPDLPVPNDDPGDKGGSGLHIIDHLADRWGTTPTPDGKTVWAEFAQPHPDEPAPEEH